MRSQDLVQHDTRATGFAEARVAQAGSRRAVDSGHGCLFLTLRGGSGFPPTMSPTMPASSAHETRSTCVAHHHMLRSAKCTNTTSCTSRASRNRPSFTSTTTSSAFSPFGCRWASIHAWNRRPWRGSVFPILASLFLPRETGTKSLRFRPGAATCIYFSKRSFLRTPPLQAFAQM